MILSTHPSHPNSRAYVLKLHRDARPAAGRLAGSLENLSTGQRFAFGSVEELVTCLAGDLDTTPETARNIP